MALGRLAAPKAQDATAGGLQLRGTFRAVGQDQERAVQGQVPAPGPLLARPVISDETDECAFCVSVEALCNITSTALISPVPARWAIKSEASTVCSTAARLHCCIYNKAWHLQ